MTFALVAVTALVVGAPAITHAQQRPPAASGDAEGKARSKFEQAAQLAGKGRWAEACPLFRDAHELFPTNGTALRLADCYERTDRPDDAYDLYAFVVKNAAEEKHPERVEIAKARIVAIEEKRAAKPGAAPPAPAATAPQASSSSEPPPAGPSRTPAYVAFGVGAAGVVVGAVFGGLALAQAGSVKDACPNAACSTPDLLAQQQEEKDAAMAKGWVANVGFGVGIVGIALGAVLLATSSAGTQATGHAPSTFVVRF